MQLIHFRTPPSQVRQIDQSLLPGESRANGIRRLLDWALTHHPLHAAATARTAPETQQAER